MYKKPRNMSEHTYLEIKRNTKKNEGISIMKMGKYFWKNQGEVVDEEEEKLFPRYICI